MEDKAEINKKKSRKNEFTRFFSLENKGKEMNVWKDDLLNSNYVRLLHLFVNIFLLSIFHFYPIFFFYIKYREYKEKIDNKVIQVEGEIYWEAKSTLQRFASNEPSSGLWRILLVMLNQRCLKVQNTKAYCILHF